MRENLREEVIVVAMKNARQRFFIPSVDNYFGGIQYDFVMIDNGSNSLLLPFPSSPEVLQQYNDAIFSWEILWSEEPGAVHSPTLIINRIDGVAVGNIVLSGRHVAECMYLRFHLGSESAQMLINHPRLDSNESQKLQGFLDKLGEGHSSPERTQVFLGQAVLSKFYSFQAGKMFLLLKKGHLPVRDDLIAAWNLIKNFEKPEGFNDLVDEDHDGDCTLSFDDEDWDESFFIDEPGTTGVLP